jgi:hypothetical protein
MIYITKLHIENYRCFENLDIDFQKNINIIVGDNEAGKSTILEAINLCLSGLLHGRYLKNELTEHLFNYNAIAKYLQACKIGSPMEPPHILLEIYLDSDEDNGDFHNLRGTGHSKGGEKVGIKLKIAFDTKFQAEYEILIKEGISNLPIEYYQIIWSGFNRDNITARSIPLKPHLINSSGVKYRNGSDFYISRIITEQLEEKEKIAITQAYRKLKNEFKDKEALQSINAKITNMANISDKNIAISVNTADINAWENILITYFNEIPFHQIGQGEQCIVKTNLALSNVRTDISNLILLEEPENHLSHIKLNVLLKNITNVHQQKQLIITTHSSFVANKLGLKNLLFIHDKIIFKFKELAEDTQNYFLRLPGYNTLRLLLAQKCILVEGPSDELIIQKCFFDGYERLPIESGIDVISVGLSAPRFLELAAKLNIKVAVVTDNDGDYQKNIVERYKKYENYSNIKIFSNRDDNQNTLEPSFIHCHIENEKKLDKLFQNRQISDLSEYLQKNKTFWALKIFESSERFNFPDYINKCIKWICQ